MKKVISASRRTDLVAHFSPWLSSVIRQEKSRVFGPSGHVYTVDLSPSVVHTFVLWSKNFSNLIQNENRLLDALKKYDQLYFHFTITGLGESFIEREVPPASEAFFQLESLLTIAGLPERVSIRFDPVVYWKEEGKLKTNIHFFEELAPKVSALGIKDIRFSFTQWYGKAQRRAEKHDFLYVDPSLEEKKKGARYLARIASDHKLNLFACSQDFLADVPGILPSSCIDGHLLQKLHPSTEPVSLKKDGSQRRECQCTESIDIGSYSQSCPHSCLYCYANPRV